MIFRLVLILSFFLNLHIASAQKCKECVLRDFTNKTQMCWCGEDEFCNTDSQVCKKCDERYYNWKRQIQKQKMEIQSGLKNFVDKYSNLQKVVNHVSKQIQDNRKLLNEIKSVETRLTTLLANEKEMIKAIEEDLLNLEKKLANVNVGPSQEIIAQLQMIKNKMVTLAEDIKKIKVGGPENDALIDRLKKLSEKINKHYNEDFPLIQESSEGLALLTENDLDLLDNLLSYVEGKLTNLTKIKENTDWIEKDLLTLFSLLNINDVKPISDELMKSVISINTTSSRIIAKYDDLLNKLQQLESEYSFYQRLEDLLKRLKTLQEQMKAFKQLLDNLLLKLQINNNLKNFFKQLEIFNEKEKKARRQVSQLDKLLTEETKLIDRYKSLKDVTPLYKVKPEVKKMIDKIDEIAEKIRNKCRTMDKPTEDLKI